MSIKNEPLKDIYKEIREAVKNKLKNHEDLKDAATVVYGERTRIGNMKSPAIWIVPEPYQPTLSGGHKAAHDITFNFVSLVKGLEPEKGLQQAEDLAMSVYDVISEDRTLDGLVHDVRPNQVDPGFEAGNNTQLCFAAVQFVFRMQRRE